MYINTLWLKYWTTYFILLSDKRQKTGTLWTYSDGFMWGNTKERKLHGIGSSQNNSSMWSFTYYRTLQI